MNYSNSFDSLMRSPRLSESSESSQFSRVSRNNDSTRLDSLDSSINYDIPAFFLKTEAGQHKMAVTTPSPFDDPTVSDPLKCPPLRWGLIGCGRVCHDFTQALKNLPSARVVACSARDTKRAAAFAKKHKIQKSCKKRYCRHFYKLSFNRAIGRST
jgi:hypothetical protein